MISYNDFREAASKGEVASYTALNIKSNDLCAAVRDEFEIMKRHRDSSNVSERMMHCLRACLGEYSPQQKSEIGQFGGSLAYARITGVKCRTAAALMDDIYLSGERPWFIEPTPHPTMPDDIAAGIKQLAYTEANAAQALGQPPSAEQMVGRIKELVALAEVQAKEQAGKAAVTATGRLEDILVEGEFYEALHTFILYFTRMPIAIIKGPFFRVGKRVKYVDGIPTVASEPKPFFSSPHPLDVWFSPGVSKPSEGSIIERIRLSKQDVEALRDATSYDADAIDAALWEHPDGHTEMTGNFDQARADQEEKESPVLNDSGLYDVMEFHGWVEGPTAAGEPLLEDYELDDTRAHHITVRVLGNYVISAVPNPDPMERPIYHTACFERQPGSLYGLALPEILMDVQALANAVFRALINNSGLASGPQVGINTESMGNDNAEEMYPWKRWYFTPDPTAPSSQPLIFFQPNDNSQNLMSVFERAMQYADEVSAIPRYASGGERVGGAGKTASGLAMLMGNVSKVFKYTASAVDECIGSVLHILYDMELLTDTTGVFRGDESIRTRGVQAAAKQEVERTRALEFLQVTGNPIDMQIIGPQGRGMVLQEVAEHLGFDYGKLAMAIEAQFSNPQPVPGAPPEQGGPVPVPGQQPVMGPGRGRVNEEQDNQQRTAGAGQTVG